MNIDRLVAETIAEICADNDLSHERVGSCIVEALRHLSASQCNKKASDLVLTAMHIVGTLRIENANMRFNVVEGKRYTGADARRELAIFRQMVQTPDGLFELIMQICNESLDYLEKSYSLNEISVAVTTAGIILSLPPAQESHQTETSNPNRYQIDRARQNEYLTVSFVGDGITISGRNSFKMTFNTSELAIGWLRNAGFQKTGDYWSWVRVGPPSD